MLSAATVRDRRLGLAVLVLVFIASAPAVYKQIGTDQFDETKVMVPMRDGIKLHTIIYTPKGHRPALPIIFLRTPYGVDGRAGGAFKYYLKELVNEGYIFAFQDIRGRYKSEGRFVMQRAPRTNPRDPKAIDESTDAYDTIDWLVKNVPNNNGRVGMLGVSYDGWLTAMTLLDPHPALKAISPQASPSDMFLGDDFHHNGAFRLSYGFEYAAMMETSKENSSFKFDRYDTYEWYLNLGPLSNANARYLHGKIPSWNDFVNHPNYDSFWKRQTIIPYLTRPVTVPTLNVAGWYDQEDFYGPVDIYEALEKHDPGHKNFLVVGPWNHGGWGGPSGRKLGPVDFGSDTSKDFREKIMAPFFAYYLKDKGDPNLPEATTFETGANEWKRNDSWPPREGVVKRNLCFHADGKLSFDAPGVPQSGNKGSARPPAAYDSYVSDPANPVPYRPRPVRPTYPGPEWPTWLEQDQRFVDHRPDVLTYETEPLENDVVISGDIIANLFASTTGTDSDWIVKLIDVYPEEYAADPKMGGYQLIIADEGFRGRFRKSFERPEPIVPGKVNQYQFSLHTNDHAFLKGHRIMVQVQSTWFPLIDRNPQKFVPNIFKASDSDYVKATQRIYRSAAYPSHIEVQLRSPQAR